MLFGLKNETVIDFVWSMEYDVMEWFILCLVWEMERDKENVLAYLQE